MYIFMGVVGRRRIRIMGSDVRRLRMYSIHGMSIEGYPKAESHSLFSPTDRIGVFS